MKILLVLSVLISTIVARKIEFTDCGKGEIKSVDVVPCDSEPCMFVKGSMVTITAVGVPTISAPGGQVKATVKMGNVEVDYPGIDADICHKVQCPIVKGKEYTLKYELEVASYFPDMITDMKWLGIGAGGSGTLFCASAKVGIKE